MEERRHINQNAFHLAGIIPVSGQPLDFRMDWSDCLMPIAPDYTLVERAVTEAAYAGAETIWIICNDDISPLIKYRLGEWIYDPVSVFRPLQNLTQRKIPIYYIPVHPKDYGVRDSLAWAVLYGAMVVYQICQRLSKWITPDRFYVAFPYGVYPEDTPRQYRRVISSRNGFYLRYDGKTIKDGEHLAFTFTREEFNGYRKILREESAKENINFMAKPFKGGKYPARLFTLDKIFGSGNLYGTVTDAPWYYNVDNWERYCSFLSSKERKTIVRPSSKILHKGKKWNPIGVDDDT